MSLDIDFAFQQMLQRVSKADFFSQTGRGNDLAFYIYDYAPSAELKVREHTTKFIEAINSRLGRAALEVDVLNLMVETLRNYGFLERAYDMQKQMSQEDFFNELNGVLGPDRIAEYIQEKVRQAEKKPDMVIITGIGKSYPIARAHGILNNLHSRLDEMPVILFYPGTYDKASLSLFNEFKENNYYRAFKMLD